ncbi:hypothetical protein D3C84_630640 [compost metagenome]
MRHRPLPIDRVERIVDRRLHINPAVGADRYVPIAKFSLPVRRRDRAEVVVHKLGQLIRGQVVQRIRQLRLDEGWLCIRVRIQLIKQIPYVIHRNSEADIGIRIVESGACNADQLAELIEQAAA